MKPSALESKVEDHVCKEAVIRSYDEMIKHTRSQVQAFDVATRVFSYHFPEIPEDAARLSVAEWLEPENRT